jgi:hypothetical protein
VGKVVIGDVRSTLIAAAGTVAVPGGALGGVARDVGMPVFIERVPEKSSLNTKSLELKTRGCR